MIELKHRFTGDVLFKSETATSLGDAVLEALKARANLDLAYLADAKNVQTSAPTAPREPYKRAVTPADFAERAAKYRASHPEIPVVEKLDLQILGLIDTGAGQLEMRTWHTCETPHCRAGWAIQLAGEAGKALEQQYGPERAGALIYRASTGRVPHFFGTNEQALRDIRRRAEEQREK